MYFADGDHIQNPFDPFGYQKLMKIQLVNDSCFRFSIEKHSPFDKYRFSSMQFSVPIHIDTH